MDIQQVCQVCFSKAKPGQRFHTHYGATCCLSCKAFFRRCYQDESKAKSLQCQNDKKCNLKQIKRYECKQCRLEKCLEIGMKPELVLQGENRLKYTHRKQKKKKLTIADGFLLQSIKDTYDQTVESIPVDELHLSILLDGFSNVILWDQRHTNNTLLLIGRLRTIVSKFVEACLLFQDFSDNDKSVLVNQNGNLFIQYKLQKFLTASNAFDQLMTFHIEPELAFKNYQPVSLAELNRGGQIISVEDPSMSRTYFQCLTDLNTSSEHDGLVLTYLLANTNNLHLEDCDKVTNVQELSMDLLNEDKEHLEKMKQILFKMVDITLSLSLTTYFDSVITDEEHSWVNGIIELFRSTHDEIGPDLNYLEIMKRVTIDSDRSLMMSYTKQGLALYHLRFQRILSQLSNSQVQRLDRVKIMHANYELGILLNVVKMDGKLTFRDQMQHVVGRRSLDSLDYLTAYNKVDFLVNDLLPVLPSHMQTKQFDKSVQRLRFVGRRAGQFVQSDEIYILTSLVILLNDSTNGRIKIYQNLIKKYLMVKMSQHFQEFGIHPTIPYSIFIADMKEFAKLSKSFINVEAHSREHFDCSA